VSAVATGKVSPWQLGWGPLMNGGAERGIIAQWVETANRFFVDERDRADLGSIA
jgi:hypothetical protein